jgi:diadenosine tetraphosphatase ApaH/serine/threonine PP2A family protein phosphatase
MKSCVRSVVNKKKTVSTSYGASSRHGMYGEQVLKTFQKMIPEGPSFMQVAELMAKKCDDEEMGLFAGIARRVWLRRNEFVHEGKFTRPSTLVQQAMEAQTEYLEANSQPQPSYRDDVDVPRWTAPAKGFAKINWDTAICLKRGVVGMGAVIHDSAGRVLAVRCMVKIGRFTPLVAEAWAEGQALIFGKELGLTNITLEGDSKLVVDAINSADGSWSIIGHLIDGMKIIL